MIVGLLIIGDNLTFVHSRWREKGCILCRRAEKLGNSQFCYSCKRFVRSVAPVLTRVPEDNETYDNGAQCEYLE